MRAFCHPKLYVDQTLAQQVLEDEIATRVRLIKESGVTEKQLSSNKQFAEVLRARGVEPPMKLSPRTGELTYAFAKADISFQELAKDPEVEPLYKARLAAKSTIGHTRAARLLSHGVPGPLPILMNYCAAHTMRWGGADKMNPQNLPTKRTGDDRLRRSIIAPPGYVICVADSAQIEARMLAWLAGEAELLNIFRRGEDPYAYMAQKIFGYEVEKKSTERQLGKTAVLGLGYGMGAERFQTTVQAGIIGPAMDLSMETADRIVQVYRATNPMIKRVWRAFGEGLAYMVSGERKELYGLVFDGTEIHMPNGLSLHYPGLKAKFDGYRYFDFSYNSRKGPTNLHGALITENVIQSLARSTVATQALKVAEKYDVVLLVHDEVDYLAKESEAEEACTYGLECLSTPPTWCADLPVAAEVGYATNYSK
jgi:DNA polymerase